MLSNKELRVLGGGPWDTSTSLNEAELNGARKEQSRRVHDATECFVVLSDSADIVITGGTDGSGGSALDTTEGCTPLAHARSARGDARRAHGEEG